MKELQKEQEAHLEHIKTKAKEVGYLFEMKKLHPNEDEHDAEFERF